MKQIHDLLHDSSLTVSGASMVNMRQEFHATITEADGITGMVSCDFVPLCQTAS